MITVLLHLLRRLLFLFGGHRQLALENLALRHQLAVYRRTTTCPSFIRPTAFSGSGWPGIWAGSRQLLLIVTPDTILRWPRRRFHEYWTRLSGARPEVAVSKHGFETPTGFEPVFESRHLFARSSGSIREAMTGKVHTIQTRPLITPRIAPEVPALADYRQKSPIASSRWSGTGTVTLPVSVRRCMAT
jgi:hypothetical protein